MSNQIIDFTSARNTRKDMNNSGADLNVREDSITDLTALEKNIEDSFDQIESMRGIVQFWEGRPSFGAEFESVLETYRIMHGELLGLTTRIRELRDRAESLLEAENAK